MFATYQASSGIYIMMALAVIFRNWCIDNQKLLSQWKFLLQSMISFAVGLILSRGVALLTPSILDEYRGTNTFELSDIFIGFASNIWHYIKTIRYDFGPVWKILIALIVVFFIVSVVIYNKKRRPQAVFVSVAFLVISFIFSLGVYPLLQQMPVNPRSLYPVGFLIGLISVFIVVLMKKRNISNIIFVLPTIALCWCWLTFAFSYGNALTEQGRWQTFRETILAHDLGEVFRDGIECKKIFITGSIGFTPEIDTIAKGNRIIYQLIPIQLSGPDWWWGLQHIAINYRTDRICPAWSYLAEDLANPEVLLDNFYHTIEVDDKKIVRITLK
jgi:hypothetical protein